MTEKAKPSIADLVQRVDVLEASLDRMIAAFKEDLAVLRGELRRLESPPATRPSAPQPLGRPSGARRSISEELALHPKKRDPRMDD